MNNERPRDASTCSHPCEALASGVCRPAGMTWTCKLGAQSRRACCWRLSQTLFIVYPAPLQVFGTHVKMQGTFLSAAQGTEQRLLCSCVPAYHLPPHKPLGWGWKGATGQAGNASCHLSSRVLLHGSQGKGLDLSGRRRRQRDIFRESSQPGVVTEMNRRGVRNTL